jgi:hypothetical protein
MKTKKTCNCGCDCNHIKEDGAVAVPTNSVGTGAIAGIGIGTQGEPGVNKKRGLTPFMTFIRRKNPK